MDKARYLKWVGICYGLFFVTLIFAVYIGDLLRIFVSSNESFFKPISDIDVPPPPQIIIRHVIGFIAKNTSSEPPLQILTHILINNGLILFSLIGVTVMFQGMRKSNFPKHYVLFFPTVQGWYLGIQFTWFSLYHTLSLLYGYIEILFFSMILATIIVYRYEYLHKQYRTQFKHFIKNHVKLLSTIIFLYITASILETIEIIDGMNILLLLLR